MGMTSPEDDVALDARRTQTPLPEHGSLADVSIAHLTNVQSVDLVATLMHYCILVACAVATERCTTSFEQENPIYP